MASECPTTSRRAVIGALAVTPAMAFAPSAIAASHNADNAWELARHRYEQAKAEYERFYETVLEPAEDDAARRVARPDLKFSLPKGDGSFTELQAKPWDLDEWCQNPYFAKYVGPIRDCWRAYLIEKERVESELGIPAIQRKYNEIEKAFFEAEQALIETATPNAAALAYKVAVMREATEGCEFSDEQFGIIAADANRLAAVQ